MEIAESSYKRYLGLDTAVENAIRKLTPILAPHVPAVVDQFYARMEKIPEAMRIFRGGREQLIRQRMFLSAWLAEVFQPPYDADYVERRRKVGVVHLNAGVDERLMIASMNWLKTDLVRAIHGLDLPPELPHATAEIALIAVLDFDLGIILNSYWTDLRSRTMRIDRLALIGQFTAAINHELRNPLGVINTSSWLLRQKLGDSVSADAAKHLDKIDRSVERANSIVSGLLRLMRIQEPARNEVDVGEFLREIVSETRKPGGVAIDLVTGECRSPGSFDKDQMRQVVRNLIDNAVEALGSTGRIEVRFASDPISTSISVRDDGPGIPEDVRRRVFEPLFTTKAFGTGLGLTLAKAIVEAHGGALTLSSPASGACFEIRVPHFLVPQPNFGSEPPHEDPQPS